MDDEEHVRCALGKGRVSGPRDNAPSDTIVPFLQNGEYGVTYAPHGNGEWLNIFK